MLLYGLASLNFNTMKSDKDPLHGKDDFTAMTPGLWNLKQWDSRTDCLIQYLVIQEADRIKTLKSEAIIQIMAPH